MLLYSTDRRHGSSHTRKVDSLDVRASWLGAVDYELREIACGWLVPVAC